MEFTRFADERGVLLLALQSEAGSWPRRPQEVSRGPDAANFNAALAALTARAPVDSARVVLLGFSDGASHALSFGLARPKTFRAILAMSPGYAFAPRRPDPTQPIFIAHGRRDRVLPAANVREMIKGLEGVGYRLRSAGSMAATGSIPTCWERRWISLLPSSGKGGGSSRPALGRSP